MIGFVRNWSCYAISDNISEDPWRPQTAGEGRERTEMAQ